MSDAHVLVPVVMPGASADKMDADTFTRDGDTIKRQRVDASIVLNPDMFNEYAHRHTGVASTLAVATVGGSDTTITVVDGSVFAADDYVQISNGTIELTFAKIISIAVNVLTLDRRIDNVHPIGTDVEVVTFEMAVLGTLASPVEFIIKPEGTSIVHVLRVTVSMVHALQGDMSKFGGIAALTNGVLIRQRNNGVYKTLTSWKDNDQIGDDAGTDIVFTTRSGGLGSYGTAARWSFYRFEVEVRLDATTSDQIEVYVQDDLTGLAHFSIKAQGHYA